MDCLINTRNSYDNDSLLSEPGAVLSTLCRYAQVIPTKALEGSFSLFPTLLMSSVKVKALHHLTKGTQPVSDEGGIGAPPPSLIHPTLNIFAAPFDRGKRDVVVCFFHIFGKGWSLRIGWEEWGQDRAFHGGRVLL